MLLVEFVYLFLLPLKSMGQTPWSTATTVNRRSAAGEGKEVGDIVKFAFYVLGGDAATVVEHLLGEFPSNHEVCFTGAFPGP
jgi:hypothetical protein